MKFSSVFGIAVLAAAGGQAKPAGPWINDGLRSCLFDQNVTEVKCTQFHQFSGGNQKWMWKAPNGLEVHYSPRLGLVGVSTFTVGEISDTKLSLPRHASDNAVSYAPNRNDLIIGIPGEGYEFSVKDELPD